MIGRNSQSWKDDVSGLKSNYCFQIKRGKVNVKGELRHIFYALRQVLSSVLLVLEQSVGTMINDNLFQI